MTQNKMFQSGNVTHQERGKCGQKILKETIMAGNVLSIKEKEEAGILTSLYRTVLVAWG